MVSKHPLLRLTYYESEIIFISLSIQSQFQLLLPPGDGTNTPSILPDPGWPNSWKGTFMKRSAMNGQPQIISGADPGMGQLAPAAPQQIVVQLPPSAQLLSMVNQVLANPDAVVQHAVSMIDETHNSVSIRERIVVYIEED